MTKATVGDWSQTASSNGTIDGSNVAESCPMAGLNNAIRSIAAGVRGSLTLSTMSLTDSYVGAMSPTPDGYGTNVLYSANFLTANSKSAATANLNSLGAKNLVRGDGATLNVGDVLGAHLLHYDGTSLRVLNPRSISSINDATNGGISLSATAGAVSINLAPGDLAIKTTPTTSDSVIIMDAAASNAGKTATLPHLLAAYPTSIMTFHIGAGQSVLANATTYIGPADAETVEVNSQIPVPFAGTVSALYAAATGAPGVGQTFVYTLRKNAADTSITCTTSGGSASTSSDTAHTATVAAGDLLNIKVVTSSTASAVVHGATILLTRTS